MNVHAAAVVFNEAHLPEPIQKETDPRPGGADHFGEGFLTHFRDKRYRFRFLTKVGHQQEEPGEAFFAGVEKMIHEVGFHANVPGKQIGEKAFGELRVPMKECDHRSLFDPDNCALLNCAGGGHAKRLTRKTALAEETGFRQDGNHGFFATLGYHRELHLAALDVEHRVCRVPLRKDGFVGNGTPG